MTNMVNAMSNTSELNVSNIKENVFVETKNNSTAITGEPEEYKAAEIDNSITTDENRMDISEELKVTDIADDQENQKAKEIKSTPTLPQTKSSVPINPTAKVEVSDEAALRNAVTSGNQIITLQQDITLSQPLIINQDNIVIEGNDKKIILNAVSYTHLTLPTMAVV